MADKKIKVKVDVEPPDVEPTIANLKKLKREIQYRKRLKELRKRDPFIYK